ncbi:MAG: hypothetical protein ACFB10_22865 [Salibacteraceae bacterium]
MKNSFLYWMLGLWSLLLVGACEDLTEEDLRDEVVVVMAPADESITTQLPPTFWWEAVDGALQYQLQVVQPQFDSIVTLVADSTITSNQSSSITLDPGTYQWRVRALNASSESCWTTSTLTVDSSDVLTGQTVILGNPVAGALLNTDPPTFTWDVLLGAEEYRFQLYENDLNGTKLYDITGIAGNSYTPTDSLLEGVYEWGVRAEKAGSVTQYSYATFQIDLTAPAVSLPNSPASNSVITQGTTINFNWLQAPDNGTATFDTLYIAGDSLFSNIEFKGEFISPGYSDTLSVGNHFWRLRTFDAAGNSSNFSNSFRVTVQ